MPEDQPLSISDLLAQEEPKAEDLVATVRDYAKRRIVMKKEDIQRLVEKTRPDGTDITVMFQSIVKACGDTSVDLEIRQVYGDIAVYLQGKIDEVNPRPNRAE